MDIFKKRNIELAKLLYKQGRYKEAEVIIKDNLVSAESKYIMGKICLKTERSEEAKVWFREAISNNYKWILPRIEMAKLFTKEGLYHDAIREYWVCLNREPKNAILKIDVAKFYISIDNFEQAEKLLDKALKLKPNDEVILKKALEVYDNMQNYNQMYNICEKLMDKNAILANEHKTIEIMARTYFSMGKYNKTLEVFSGKTSDAVTKIMSNLYKRRIYCKLIKDEEQAKMYQAILDNLEASYGEERRIRHIEKHLKDDKRKEKHGVFTKDLSEVFSIVKSAEKVKQKGKDCDIYCIKLEGCGYEGGNKGDGHKLDYVTLVTMPDTYKTITLFPSDKIELKMPKREVCKEFVKQRDEYER